MKIRSTTPTSKRVSAIKALAVVGILAIMAAVVVQKSQQVSADEYDNQIASLQSQINEYQAQANKYASEAASYEQAQAKITAEIKVISNQIALSKAKLAKLKDDIKQNEARLAESRNTLGDLIVDISMDDSISPLEMLASSDNIGDFIDKQEYRSSIRDGLTETINEIKTLKEKLESDKADVEKVIQQQSAQNEALGAKEAEQAQLAQASRSKESSYQKLVSQNKQELADASAAQQAYYEKLRAQQGGGSNGSSGGSVSYGAIGAFQFRNFSGNQGCSGGYPYCAGPKDYGVDEWQLYTRECVSYGAWAIEYRFNKQVNSFNGQGHAYQWLYSAPSYSNAWQVTNPAQNAKPGDAVVLPKVAGLAPYGHLMVVEQNLGGGWVRVSQYNYFGTGEYSTMDVKTSGVYFLRFPSK